MKTRRYYFIIFMIACSLSAMAQTIQLSNDSAKHILIGDWKFSYAMMGSTKLTKVPGMSDITYAFFNNNSFLLKGSTPNMQEKGSWQLNTDKHTIELSVGSAKQDKTYSSPVPTEGPADMTILSLTAEEIIMIENNAGNANTQQLKLILKRKVTTPPSH